MSNQNDHDIRNDDDAAGKKTQSTERKAVQIGVFVTIPFLLAVPPIVGWFLGTWIDQYLGTQPYLAFILLACGFIAGFREMFRVLKRFSDDND
jgi:ATP synthase protein I